jgi:hypothetical protein
VIELDAYLLAGSLHARFACFVCSGEEWIELKDDVSTFVLQTSDVLNIQTRPSSYARGSGNKYGSRKRTCQQRAVEVVLTRLRSSDRLSD